MSLLSDQQRQVLYEVGETLIPPAPGELSADQTGVPGALIDRVLALRPELTTPLGHTLESGHGLDPETFCRRLQRDSPEEFDLVTFVLVGAYFLNPRVRDSYGYHGHPGEPQDGSPQPEYAEGGLLDPVVAHGPIYRRTP
jgi:hypothetical protein